ncbi:MAG: dihydrodipicolinate synthase family protein [Phycisphaerales bacterium]|nr:dihydrodipicolinate synthase family protein [Phycisphaerales bacterium]|tara:strand:- start:119 stop:1033 length:915 start_codon:yes stop_codon:yes gene_type:complete
MELLQGLSAATYTPTNDDGSLNLDVVPAYAEHLGKSAVNSVFICGTTGESVSFTMSERIDLIEAWCPEAKKQGLATIFHAGSPCQSEAIEMSKAAAAAGVDVIAAMAPPCIPPASVDDLVEFLKPIAKAAGETPFLFYDNPSRSHVDFPPTLTLDAMMGSIPNFAGVKLTRCDLENLEQAVETCGDDAQVIFACDQMLLFGLQLGVKSAIGAAYNHSAGLFQQMMNAHEAGDMITATAAHDKVVVMIDVLEDHGIIPAGRTVMKLAGLDLGPPRPPLRPITKRSAAELANALEALGLPDRPMDH